MAKTEIQLVPDIGGASQVDVIEVAVSVGDLIAKEQTLVTLEGDKATMDVPATLTGKVLAVLVKVGDKVSEGSPIIEVALSQTSGVDAEKTTPKSVESLPVESQKIIEKSLAPAAPKQLTSEKAVVVAAVSSQATIYAGPGVRRFAYELGVDLTKVVGSGRKGRILKEDVQQFVKAAMQSGVSNATGFGQGLLPWPVVDFSKFGTIETTPLSKIKKVSGANLHRNWVQIPHVTQFDEADVTELENFRHELRPVAEKQGFKLTALVFIMKAVVAALKEFPTINASLDASGESLILKHYYHIGVAVDTPNGLVVPVIRDVDQKGFVQLAKELAQISEKAREKGLSVTEMQGGCFTISSLGGISGTAFTPIINAPEVGILGVSRMQMKPVYVEGEFKPRLMLPLSFSYDHRVIDGAEAARFTKALSRYLTDIRQILL